MTAVTAVTQKRRGPKFSSEEEKREYFQRVGRLGAKTRWDNEFPAVILTKREATMLQSILRKIDVMLDAADEPDE